MSKQEQDHLTWLALNVNEWPTKPGPGKACWAFVNMHDEVTEISRWIGAVAYSKKKWLKRRTELQAQPKGTPELPSNEWERRQELPPIGIRCMYAEQEVEITAHAKFGICFVVVANNEEGYAPYTEELHHFHPIKPDADEKFLTVTKQCNELLAALEVSLAAMEHMGNALYEMDVVTEGDEVHFAAFDQVRAAIAKAKGGAA